MAEMLNGKQNCQKPFRNWGQNRSNFHNRQKFGKITKSNE